VIASIEEPELIVVDELVLFQRETSDRHRDCSRL
jgi:hypothetical protein